MGHFRPSFSTATSIIKTNGYYVLASSLYFFHLILFSRIEHWHTSNCVIIVSFIFCGTAGANNCVRKSILWPGGKSVGLQNISIPDVAGSNLTGGVDSFSKTICFCLLRTLRWLAGRLFCWQTLINVFSGY